MYLHELMHESVAYPHPVLVWMDMGVTSLDEHGSYEAGDDSSNRRRVSLLYLSSPNINQAETQYTFDHLGQLLAPTLTP